MCVWDFEFEIPSLFQKVHEIRIPALIAWKGKDNKTGCRYMRGKMEIFGGMFVTQTSIWNIINDEDDEQIRSMLRRISKENKEKSCVKIEITVKER